MQNSGLGPGQSRNGKQVLGLAKWATLQAFTEAECQVGHPKLLLRTGTGLEQPPRCGPVRNAVVEACLISGPIGVLRDRVGYSLPCYWRGTPLHGCLLALAWGSVGVGRSLHESPPPVAQGQL